MEGDAKGAVGGMTMADSERRRLATESKGWKCGTCKRSNEAILAESGKGAETQKAEMVPEELKFGFRDEMEKSVASRGNTGDGTSERGNQSDAISQPADPVVDRVAPVPTATTAGHSQETTATQSQSASNSTPSQTTLSQPIRAQAQNAAAQPATSSEGVPPWIDKAIVWVVAALAVMVAKKIML